MGRNEIRLRRQMMSSGRIARHRNYSELMREHGRITQMKRVFRVFTYFLIVLFLLIILIIVLRWEKKQAAKDQKSTRIEHVDTRAIMAVISESPP
jgi:preprotein translocase subunit SecG